MTKFYLDLEPAQHARMPADRFDESRGLAAEYVEAERIFQLAPTIPLCSRAAPAAAVRRANTPRTRKQRLWSLSSPLRTVTRPVPLALERVDDFRLHRRNRRHRARVLSSAATPSSPASPASATAVRPADRSSRPCAASMAAVLALAPRGPLYPLASNASRRDLTPPPTSSLSGVRPLACADPLANRELGVGFRRTPERTLLAPASRSCGGCLRPLAP